MPYMYILECGDGSYYVGSTWDLTRRLWEHENGLGGRHTSKHLPVKLVHCEFYPRIIDAYARERQVKGWSRAKKEALITGDVEALARLAQCQNPTRATRAS
jgi:putative endonuclease